MEQLALSNHAWINTIKIILQPLLVTQVNMPTFTCSRHIKIRHLKYRRPPLIIIRYIIKHSTTTCSHNAFLLKIKPRFLVAIRFIRRTRHLLLVLLKVGVTLVVSERARANRILTFTMHRERLWRWRVVNECNVTSEVRARRGKRRETSKCSSINTGSPTLRATWEIRWYRRAGEEEPDNVRVRRGPSRRRRYSMATGTHKRARGRVHVGEHSSLEFYLHYAFTRGT